MSVDLRASYDEFPYESFSFPATHPEQLAAQATLFGLQPPPPESCRVLELGCASGGNLIPMAATLPHARFLGIDLSAVQVRQGAADIELLSLANVRLLEQSIMDFPPEHGEFDYIIAHGVFSWVPAEVQEKILALCARHLSRDGVAYVSYNTLPGWRMRSIVREAMTYHVQQFSDPKTRAGQARAILDFLAQASADPTFANGIMYGAAYAELMRAEAQWVTNKADSYLLHDHLESVNEPVYFHQFIDRAGRYDLAYLCESDFKSMLIGDLAPPIADVLKRIAPDEIRREQFLDFLRNRAFRQTLLVRRDRAPLRKVTPEHLTALYIASKAQPQTALADPSTHEPAEFRTPTGEILKTNDPLTKAALVMLAENSPRALPFAELLALAMGRLGDGASSAGNPQRSVFAQRMLGCYGARIVELHAAPSAFVRQAGARPVASVVARLQAQRGAQVTNLRHESITLDEPLRAVMPLLDGSRERATIAATLWPALSSHEAAARLERTLLDIAGLALLSG